MTGPVQHESSSKYPSQENSDFTNTNLKWAFCVKLVAKATRKGLVFQEI